MNINELQLECQNCRKCEIGGVEIETGKFSNVFSNMNREAEIMVVGQNPGLDEVRQGEPFVGTSGKIFDQACEDVLGIDRSKLYICNVVRCCILSNRKPNSQEIVNCRDFLDKEIKVVKPKIVISLGTPALKQLTGVSGVTKHAGEVIWSIRYEVNVLALLHPSPQNTNHPEKKRLFFEAIAKVKEYL